MRKRAHVMIACRYFLALGLALTLLMPGTGWGEVLKVAQPNQSLYPDPDFSSTPVASVPEGAEVNVETQAGDWYKVEYQGTVGWINRQAFGKPQASGGFSLPGLLTGKPVKETSSDEVALAGKGFTPEIENSYRCQTPGAEFCPGGPHRKFYGASGQTPSLYQGRRPEAMRRLTWLVLLAAAPFLMGGCLAMAVAPVAAIAYKGATKAHDASRPITPSEEYYVGRAVAARILTQYKLDQNARADGVRQ